MPALNKLTISTLNIPGPCKLSDGGGLWIYKADKPTGSDTEKKQGKWVLRVHVHGRRREMGLGTYPEVGLAEVRETARHWRKLAKQGQDPIKTREDEKRAAERNMHVLSDISKDAFESRKAELKGDGKAGRWFSPLELHVLPKLGKVPVSDLDQRDIRDTLLPIWHTKAETASKALKRLSICIRHAAALGLDVDIQVTDKARALLGKQRHTTKHTPALSWSDVPAFYQSLCEGTITELALRLLILTAVRSSPLRFLHLDQIRDDVWTIPAEAMKGARDANNEFRVPLSSEALAVIEQAKPFARDGLLFPGVRRGVISDATMSRYMERRKLEARPHGFRTSFRVWTAEKTDAPREVAETCLSHVVGGKVERAYRRTDYLDQRKVLMERWGLLLAGRASADVLDLKAHK